MKEAPMNEASPIVVDENPDFVNERPSFYIVSQFKFWVFMVLTLGAFQLPWLYINWKRQNDSGHDRTQPFWRTVFGIFFYHDLVRRIKEQSEIEEIRDRWNGATVAVGLILTTIFARIIDRTVAHLPEGNSAKSSLDILGWVLMFAIAYLVSIIQSKINQSLGDPKGETNSKITLKNILWVIALWAFVIIAMFVYLMVTGQI